MGEIIHPGQSKSLNRIRNIILNWLRRGYGILLLRTYRMEYPIPHAMSYSFVSSSVHWYSSLFLVLIPSLTTSLVRSPPPPLITLSPYLNNTFLSCTVH